MIENIDDKALNCESKEDCTIKENLISLDEKQGDSTK